MLPLFFLGLWLTEQIELPLLGIAPPSWQWGSKEILIDMLHHIVYATGAVISWNLLGIVR